MPSSTARLCSTGNAPGKPRQTGQVFEFGGSPKRVEQAQKALVNVFSCTWTSSPITGSYIAITSGDKFMASCVSFAIRIAKYTIMRGHRSRCAGLERRASGSALLVSSRLFLWRGVFRGNQIRIILFADVFADFPVGFPVKSPYSFPGFCVCLWIFDRH